MIILRTIRSDLMWKELKSCYLSLTTFRKSLMLKVMTIVGTRPELIKMSRVIAEFDQHTQHILVHTGQNYDYELNQVFFEDLKIRKPDYFLEAAGKNAAQTIAQVVMKADEVLEK